MRSFENLVELMRKMSPESPGRCWRFVSGWEGILGKLPRIVKKLRRIPENVFFVGGGIILKLERNWDRNLQRIVQES